MFSYAGSVDGAVGSDDPMPDPPRARTSRDREPTINETERTEHTWLSIDAACKLLGVDQSTLRRWSDSGKIPVFRTPGGHRRYNEEDLRALVREALRMRPDRLVVGEVRGAECVDLLAALNVGHDGGAGTLHANSPVDVPARVEALCTAGGLSRAAAHSQLAAGLRAIVHLTRDQRGRRLHSIAVLRRTAFAGALNGSMPMRRTVSMKRSLAARSRL